MADDEPIYRRYYRNINDNRMYPLNMDISKHKIDRINVDRRLHISPPGQTTRHKITEYFIDNHRITDPLQIVMDIIKKDPFGGDILLFRPGQGDIMKDIKKLNKILPNNVIALPYYSQLDKDKKKIVENIEKQKYFIKMDKSNDFNEVDPMIGNNNYNRVIVVATNIAEASITIKTLKYVIETGKQKTSRYNYKKRISTLTEDNISESSRLQRRGRVGRVGPGTVYYTYEQGLMENNKTQYNISIQEISMELYRRLYDKSDDDILFDDKNDPCNHNNFGNITITSIKNMYKNGIYDAIQKQYFIGDIFYSYYGNISQYDYQNYTSLPKYYVSGFDMATLNDSKCCFYIIHPEELFIRRNIVGQVVGLAERIIGKDILFVDGKITSKKMLSFWDTLFNSLYIIHNGNDICKSFYGKIMQKSQDLLEIEDQKLFATYIYSIAYGIDEQIIRLMSYIKAAPRYFLDLSINKNKVKIISDKQKSDVEAILYILQKFHKVGSDYATMKDMCNIMGINILVILKYFENYNAMKKLFNEKIEKDTNIGLLVEMIRNNLIDRFIQDDYSKITACLLVGYPYNIVKNIKDSPYYISIYNPESDNIYSIQKIANTASNDTYVDMQHLSEYILYMSTGIDDNTIKVLHYINPKMLKNIGRIYGLNKMKSIYENIRLYTNPSKNPNIPALINYTSTIGSIVNDLQLYTAERHNGDII